MAEIRPRFCDYKLSAKQYRVSDLLIQLVNISLKNPDATAESIVSSLDENTKNFIKGIGYNNYTNEIFMTSLLRAQDLNVEGVNSTENMVPTSVAGVNMTLWSKQLIDINHKIKETIFFDEMSVLEN